MAMRSNNPYIQHLPLIALDEEVVRSPSVHSKPGSETSPQESPLVSEKSAQSPFSTTSSPGYNQFSGPTLFQPYKPKPTPPSSSPHSSPPTQSPHIEQVPHVPPQHVPPPAPSVPPMADRRSARTLLAYQNSLRFGPRTEPQETHLSMAQSPPQQRASFEIPRPPSILNPDPIPSHYRPARRFPSIGETIVEESDGSKESVMRGQYVDVTTPVSFDFRPMSALSGMNAKLQQAQEMLSKSRITNAQGSYEPNLKLGVIEETKQISEDDALSSLEELFPNLHNNHLKALYSFAVHLNEDAAMLDRGQKSQDASRRTALTISRKHKWKLWSDGQDKDRRKFISQLSPDVDLDSEASSGDEKSPPGTPRNTIQDLLSGSDADTPSGAPEPPVGAPSPTPTDIQVASAPKVDLVLQMPRPMPGVPTSRLDPSSHDEDVDTSVLADAVRGFASRKHPRNTITLEDSPVVLRQAWAALDTACNNPSLESFLRDARQIMESKENEVKLKYQKETQTRNSRNQQHFQALVSSNRASPSELQRVKGDMNKDEVQTQLNLQRDLYYTFETSFIEVAYKEVKSQLEVLAGKWYEDVKHWLLHAVSASDPTATTSSEYRLFLDCLDLLNKFNSAIEDHERVLQNLIAERNTRFLEVSMAPFLASGNNAEALNLERRFWVDEQERILVTKNETVKRARDYASVGDRISMDIVDRLKKRFESLVAEVNKVILQFPNPVLPELFRRFFGYDTKGKVLVPSNDGFSVPAHVVASLGDTVEALTDIVHLIKVALDLSQDSQAKLVNANVALQISEDYARMHTLSSPAAMAAATTTTITSRQPLVTKRLADEHAQRTSLVQDELFDVLRKLRAMLADLHKNPNLPAVEVREEEYFSGQVYTGSGQWTT